MAWDLILLQASRKGQEKKVKQIKIGDLNYGYHQKKLRTNATAPAINVLEHDDKYELELAAPGLTKDDFKVSLDTDGNLSINMEKKQEENGEKKHGHYLRREFSYSQYQQIMTLPEDADREHIEAKVENGVLTVNIPKIVKKPQEAHKLIEVK